MSTLSSDFLFSFLIYFSLIFSFSSSLFLLLFFVASFPNIFNLSFILTPVEITSCDSKTFVSFFVNIFIFDAKLDPSIIFLIFNDILISILSNIINDIF